MGESDLSLPLCTFSDELASQILGYGTCGKRKSNLGEEGINKSVILDRILGVKRLAVDICYSNLLPVKSNFWSNFSVPFFRVKKKYKNLIANQTTKQLL